MAAYTVAAGDVGKYELTGVADTEDTVTFTDRAIDEVDIVVQNVSLTELAQAPHKASVTFQKLLYAPGTRQERARQTFIAQIDFTLRDRVPNEFVRVNPLGLQVSYFRVDQAFEEGQTNGR